MPPRAPPVAKETWDRHKEEIIAVFLAPKSSLEQTMQRMKTKHGFNASQNQYTAQLKKWRVKKNAKSDIWKFVDTRLKKRKFEGKDSDVLKYGKKVKREIVDKEIARNVTLTGLYTNNGTVSTQSDPDERKADWSLDEDAPTPEGIQIMTPSSADQPLINGSIRVDNLPYIQFTSALEYILLGRLAPNLDFPEPENEAMQSIPFSYSTEFTAFFDGNAPSMADDLNLSEGGPLIHGRMIIGDINTSNGHSLVSVCLSGLSHERSDHNTEDRLRLSLRPYILKEPDSALGVTLRDLTISNDPSCVLKLLSLFVFLSTNNLLSQWHIEKGVSWILENMDPSSIINLSQINSPAARVFFNNMFLVAVKLKNEAVVKRMLEIGVDVNTPFRNRETALAIAAAHADLSMVKTLCKAGANPILRRADVDFYGFGGQYCLWNPPRIEILRFLLDVGADPQAFIVDEQLGFPLIQAAVKGSIESIQLLLDAGADVNVFVVGRFGTALQAAIANSHHEVAVTLIRAGANVNEPVDITFRNSFSHGILKFLCRSRDDAVIYEFLNRCRQTPLQLAAKANNLVLVKTLIKNGAVVNLCPTSRYYVAHGLEECLTRKSFEPGCSSAEMRSTVYTALQYAAKNQNIELVSLLLCAGAFVDSRIAPTFGDTPLQIAAGLGNMPICLLLLQNGADLNAPVAKFNGRTAIQAAAESGNLELCHMLLSIGAELNTPAGLVGGLTALQAALLGGHSSVARFLMAAGADIHAQPAPVSGFTSVQAATMPGDINVLEEVLREGAIASAPASDIDGMPALHIAVSLGATQLLEVLLMERLDVDERSSCGRTALQEAVRMPWVEGAECLLRCGANINALPLCGDHKDSDFENFTALGWAIHNNDEDMVDYLLEIGTDPRIPTNCCQDGYSDASIHAISADCSHHIVDMLFEAGMHVGPLCDNKSALTSATGALEPDIEIVELILAKTSKRPRSLYMDHVSIAWQAIRFRFGRAIYVEVLDLLLQAGVDVNIRHRHSGETNLQRALAAAQPEAARFLLDKGADVNVPSTEETGTPLQEAIKNNLQDIIYILLDHKPNVNAPPAKERGVTALQAAAIQGHVQLAKELLERGADVTAPAAEVDGRTAIDGAAEHGRLDMLQLLFNALGDREDLTIICNGAADFAKKEGHLEIARWLREYRHV